MAVKTTRQEARRALVTGASAGIGEAFARRLAGDGYELVLVARSANRLSKLARELTKEHGVKVEILAADLTDGAELRTVEKAAAGPIALDLLVNNAGFGTFGAFSEIDVDTEEAEIRLNVVALVRLTRAALPGMVKRRRGGIINVSSMAAFQPAPFNATYASTKAYVNSFSESLAEELRGSGVTVQALCPGFTRTEFQERAKVDTSRVPEAAWMTADEVVDASLASLASGELICIPGLQNKVLATVTGAIPRSLVRRLSGFVTRSAFGRGQ